MKKELEEGQVWQFMSGTGRTVATCWILHKLEKLAGKSQQWVVKMQSCSNTYYEIATQTDLMDRLQEEPAYQLIAFRGPTVFDHALCAYKNEIDKRLRRIGKGATDNAEADLDILMLNRTTDEHYPTQWAYDQVCAARTKWHEEAKKLEAKVAELEQKLINRDDMDRQAALKPNMVSADDYRKVCCAKENWKRESVKLQDEIVKLRKQVHQQFTNEYFDALRVSQTDRDFQRMKTRLDSAENKLKAIQVLVGMFKDSLVWPWAFNMRKFMAEVLEVLQK